MNNLGPNWPQGFVPSPMQWQSELESKVDAIEGTLTGPTIDHAGPIYFADTYGSIQAAHDAASAAGGGTVVLSASDYIISSTITVNAGVVSIIGQGLKTRILAQNIPANNPVFSFVNNSFTSSSSLEGITLGDMQICAYNVGQVHAPVNTGGAGHSAYVTNSLCYKFGSVVGLRLRNVSANNFDKGIAWNPLGQSANGCWGIDFDGCSFEGCNYGYYIPTGTSSPFERLQFRNGLIGGCNYGIWIDITNLGASVFFDGNEIDYNAIRHVVYTGSNGNTQNNALYLRNNHIETNSVCQGSAQRCDVTGSIHLIGNFIYENGGTGPSSAGFVNLVETNFSRGKAVSNHFAGINVNYPIFYTSTNGGQQSWAGGYANTWQQPGEILLSRDATGGDVAGESDIDGAATFIAGFDPSSNTLSAQRRLQVLVSGVTGAGSSGSPYIYTVVPDSTLNHAFFTRIELYTINANYWTMTPGSGVSISVDGGGSTTINGTGKLIRLTKTGGNTWQMHIL